MDTPSGGRDSRFMSYNISLLGNDQEMYGAVHRPSTSTPPMSSSRSGLCCNVNSAGSRGVKRSSNDVLYDNDGRQMIDDVVDDGFASPAPQKGSPPANGKKTKGRVKIKMEYIDNKLRRYTTFSKRKTGIMKKAYELSTLTGTQVMLLVASETGHVYTFATRKLQPMITSDAGKALIQTCLNSPDPCQGGGLGGGGGSGSCGPGGDQRMSATGFEETELSYNIATAADEEQKDGTGSESDDNSDKEDSREDLPLTNNVKTENSP